MIKNIGKSWLVFICALLLVFTSPGIADQAPASAEGVAEATESVEQEVLAETDKQAAERRKKIMQEAVDALSQTKDALTALEEERIDDALDALAVTMGKLELIVAREPELALAPTDMTITTHDLYATTDAIEAAIESARSALADGDVQNARRILDRLGSEIIITVTNLPLATYPEAIKAITPLIDDGKIEEAKSGLVAALNTLVLTDHIIPLPVIRSEALLKRAEELAEKADRSDAESTELSNHLVAVRGQLQMAELLGYGDKDDYESLYTQLDEIRTKTDSGQSGKGFFDKMKGSMSKLWGSIFG